MSQDADEFEIALLSESEYEALAEHNRKDAWVFGKMAEMEKNLDKAERYREISEYSRDRARMFTGLAARESQQQDEWEAKQK